MSVSLDGKPGGYKEERFMSYLGRSCGYAEEENPA